MLHYRAWLPDQPLKRKPPPLMRGRDQKRRPDLKAVLWIRIQWGPWIRIRIRIRNLGPDPEEQKKLTNIEKSE